MNEGMSPAPDVGALRGRFDLLQSRLNAAKIAYLNGTDLGNQEVSYATLKQIAQETIQANYELQRARYGTIRVKLSIAKLLRRGR